MAENKLANLHNIHFIGIGGAGMSAIAYVLIKRGYDVSGSDLNAGHMSAHLAEEGAMVYMGHAASQVEDAEAVVISTAIHPKQSGADGGQKARYSRAAPQRCAGCSDECCRRRSCCRRSRQNYYQCDDFLHCGRKRY